MAATTLNITTDNELKDKAQEIFFKLGFDISTAVNIFLKQAVYQGGLPFEVKLNHKEHHLNPHFILDADTSKTPVLGRLKDCIDIPDDFDEPLEEMKEYME